MDVMFWVWLGVIVVTAVVEFITCDLTSIWFTAGAIIPFILSAVGGIRWEWQLAVFIVVSALLIIFLRRITRKLLLKNANFKSNVDAYIGKQVRMLTRADFETTGSVKINDVVWSAVAFENQTIEADTIVEIVEVCGNKLVVKIKTEETVQDNIEEKGKTKKTKKIKEEL